MTVSPVDVIPLSDGTVVIQPHRLLDAEDATDLRRALIHAIRHTRPRLLILDLAEVHELDPISLGALVAACHLGDDHHVAVFFDHPRATVAALLVSAGVPTDRVRRLR